MTFDQTVMVACVIVPAVAAFITGSLASYFDAKAFASGAPHCPRRRFAAAVVATLGWTIAVLSALTMRQGWAWWPDEAWRQTTWPLVAWSLLSAIAVRPTMVDSEDGRPRTSLCMPASSWWVMASLLSLATAFVAMPTGEEWEDTYSQHRNWMPAVAAACMLNVWSVIAIAQRGGGRWLLWIVVAASVGPLLLAASTYASLAEWALAICVATFTFACVVTAGGGRTLWGVSVPAIAAMASVTAASCFYSYDVYPDWMLGSLLFLPTIAAAIDGLIPHPMTKCRVATSAAIAATILIMAAIELFGHQPEQW